jgi:hypothetical protein
MNPESKHATGKADEELEENDQELRNFIDRLDSGEFDGRLFEEIRKLRAEHLAKVCRLLVKRKFEEP